jgi:endonuclease YncB( thermonuclease family)
MKAHRKRKRKQSGRLTRVLRTILVLAVVASGFQYLQEGRVSWPGELYRQLAAGLGDYPTRPSAGWRKAADQVSNLGARREGSPAPDFDLEGRVVKIIDGDSLSLLDGHKRQHTIRLYGIDTPEWDQPHGKAAKRALRDLVNGRGVGVVAVEEDTFGRTVGTVYLEGENINLAMVAAGHAWWFTRYAPYERHLEKAEQSAREQGLGLWTGDEPIAPWHWRRTRR